MIVSIKWYKLTLRSQGRENKQECESEGKEAVSITPNLISNLHITD